MNIDEILETLDGSTLVEFKASRHVMVNGVSKTCSWIKVKIEENHDFNFAYIPMFYITTGVPSALTREQIDVMNSRYKGYCLTNIKLNDEITKFATAVQFVFENFSENDAEDESAYDEVEPSDLFNINDKSDIENLKNDDEDEFETSDVPSEINLHYHIDCLASIQFVKE